MAQNHPITPWGKQVKIRLIELGFTANDLVAKLKERGIKTSRATVSGLMHGYRGTRSDEMKNAIDEILDLEIVGRPA